MDPFAPTGSIESPKKEGVLLQVPIVVTWRQQKTLISISPRVATLKKRPRRDSLPLPKPLEPEFSPILFPPLDDIATASLLPVIGEDLQSVPFGSLFTNHLTIVCFIRHFYCPLCSDYMTSLVATANPDALWEANVGLVVISDGSPRMITPTRNLYHVLGMTLRTLDAGPANKAGDYIIHGNLVGLGVVLKNVVRMPLANAGDIKQLSGEFLLGPGPVCHYAHKMHTTKSHAPLREPLKRAGVDMNPIRKEIRHLVDAREEEKWLRERERKMVEIWNARLAKRGYLSWTDECIGSGLTGESSCDIV